MHLHKAIPMGAGLGGGSSNAAAVLQLMNEYFQLNITNQQLLKYALLLGSDCPFFLLNKPALAKGRGEILQPISLSLQQYQFVLLFPSIHISTAWAFQQITPTMPKMNLLDIVEQDITKWKNNLVNDFEIPVFKQHPDLAKLKEQLYTNGALYAAMSGSGSTLYGIFEKGKVTNLTFPKHITVKII
jgi:4-diphosphocytidyl-2-C-methyl-D-erythritol kinase